MSVNNSQTGNNPLKLLFGNNEDKSNLDQLLSVDIVTTSQQLILFTTTNMIPSQIPFIPYVSEHQNLSRRQIGRRRRRQRQQQRRRQQQREEQRRRQRQEEQQRRQRSSEQQPQQRQQPEQTARRLPSRTWSEISRHQEYWRSIGFLEYMEENTTALLEIYDWEKMDPQKR